MLQIHLIDQKLYPLFLMLMPAGFRPGAEGEYLLGLMDDDGEAVGVLWYRFRGFRYDILHIGVHPAFRRRGYGTQLLETFFGSVYESGLLFPVYLSYLDSAENAGFSLFIESIGRFFELDETTLFEVDKSDLDSSEMVKRLRGMKSNSKPFFELPREVKGQFLKRLEDEMPEVSRELKLGNGGFVHSLCLCSLQENKVVSAVFFKERADKNLELAYCYNSEKNGSRLADVLSLAIKSLDRDFEGRKIYIEAVNDSSYLLTCKIFPDPSIRQQILHMAWDFS